MDEKKIILMTKLAVYDKNQAEKDEKKLSYFRSDYVYRRNMGVRFCVAVGCLIVILLNVMHRIVIDNVDILAELDYRQEFISAAVFIVVVMAVYSCIGTVIYMTEYQKAGKRLRKYFKMLDALDQLNARDAKHADR